MQGGPHLSEKSARVLASIAEGRSYNQIVEEHADVTYLDIFNAAKEALRLTQPDQPERKRLRLISHGGSDSLRIPAPAEPPTQYQVRLAEVKQRYARAYEVWSDQEERILKSLYRERCPVAEIAHQLQRQPSAIRSRLARLELDATRPDG